MSALIAIAQLLLANLLDASSAQGDNQKNATGSIAFLIINNNMYVIRIVSTGYLFVYFDSPFV